MPFCHHCEQFDQIIDRLDRIMTAQSDVDAAVAAIQTAVATLGADVTAIQAELAAGGTPVDTSALNTAVASLVPAVNAVTALAPPPAPAPVPAQPVS